MIPDVADPDLYAEADPVPVWAGLRATAPVHWNEHRPGAGFWAVMTYRPAMQVYKDPSSFTSEQGMRLDTDPASVAAAAGKMLIVTDPPRHANVRRLMNPIFSPRKTAELEQTMRDLLEDLVDRALDRGKIDFVTEVAAVLPSAIACHLMDVEQQARLRLVELTSTAFGSSPGASGCPVSPLDQTRANVEIFEFYRTLLRDRRAAPGGDIVSLLAAGKVDGEPLTDAEILMNCVGLLNGANETTRLASAAGVLAMMENPDEWRRLCQGEVDVESAAEEILRWSSPAMHVMRVARRDTNVDGHTIRRGERVAIWNPSVNRDEAAFDRPHSFDLGRRPNRHLVFGAGNHFCIGAALARVELRVLLEVLVDKVAGFDVAGIPRMMRSNFMWGLDYLPITLRPR